VWYITNLNVTELLWNKKGNFNDPEFHQMEGEREKTSSVHSIVTGNVDEN
jgi:hypothetical protein